MFEPWRLNRQNHQYADLTPVVQLDIFGNFIAEYNSTSSAGKASGVNATAITAALRKGRHFSGNYYRYYKSEYDPSTISIKSRFSKFYIPVDKYDLDNNYICSYKTIVDAGKDNNISNSQIYKVITGELHQTGGFIYKKPA